MDIKPPLPTSKWRKHVILLRQDCLQPYLPSTDRLAWPAVLAYLNVHEHAIIKPEAGWGGFYVCKISQTKEGFVIAHGKVTETVSRESGLKKALPWWVFRRRCIVQEYIDLAPWKDRPADVRTILQRNEEQIFEVTGVFVKRAPKSRIVTNVKQGGKIGTLETYLANAWPDDRQRGVIRAELYAVSKEIGQILGKRYRNSVYGIDLGVARDGRVWIIEVNTRPSLGILKEVDRKMHRRALALYNYNRRHKMKKPKHKLTFVAVKTQTHENPRVFYT